MSRVLGGFEWTKPTRPWVLSPSSPIFPSQPILLFTGVSRCPRCLPLASQLKRWPVTLITFGFQRINFFHFFKIIVKFQRNFILPVRWVAPATVAMAATTGGVLEAVRSSPRFQEFERRPSSAPPPNTPGPRSGCMCRTLTSFPQQGTPPPCGECNICGTNTPGTHPSDFLAHFRKNPPPHPSRCRVVFAELTPHSNLIWFISKVAHSFVVYSSLLPEPFLMHMHRTSEMPPNEPLQEFHDIFFPNVFRSQLSGHTKLERKLTNATKFHVP